MNTCIWVMEDDSLCGELCEGRTSFCGSHNRTLRREAETSRKQSEKREALLEKAKEKRLIIKADTTKATYALARTKKAIRKVSKKREELNKEYNILRHQYLLEHPVCEVKLMGCEGASSEIHHTASGSNKVANLNNVSTWKAACPHCHRILHDKLSAKEARELGLKI